MPRAYFELWQDGICVASAEGAEADARREIEHYAAVYGQDGPVTIRAPGDPVPAPITRERASAAMERQILKWIAEDQSEGLSP